MNITYLQNNEIIFNGMSGKLMNNDINYMTFIHEICKIDTKNYEYIYKLNDNCAGSILLVKDLSYCYYKCGSGFPIINGSRKIGIFEYN